MAKRTGRLRRKSRSKFRKTPREKGKISVSKYFQKFNVKDKVQLLANTTYQKSLYHPRFHGKHGVIKSKRGNCYEVIIKDFKKEKTLIIHPIHLKKV